MNRAKKLIELVKHFGDGGSIAAYYAEGFSEEEIRALADKYPHLLYVSAEGLVYVDQSKIAYQKHKNSEELTFEEKELLERNYSISVDK
ncbi:hypothetical protein [Bacillus bombysepticus]|uniref:hypothetical protein n=1 Tax=Bacillus bombysepticus TaxID=658666 RepID=UPI00301AE044